MNEIPTATSMFSGSSNSVEVVCILCDMNRKSEIQDGGVMVGFLTSGLCRTVLDSRDPVISNVQMPDNQDMKKFTLKTVIICGQ
jgi:hypothetical protein